MKIFLTGGAGFIGAHTALELLKAGHELRLLVRNEAAARAYFEAQGFSTLDLVVADMLDEDAVTAAMKGCDAVVHAAALVSLDKARAQEVYDNNVKSIDVVIGTAHRLGIRNILYVSSLSALVQGGIQEINEDTPLGKPREAYSRSKRDCDAFVRKLQQEGAAVQISYPSGVIGPDDPKLSESNHALISFVKSMIPITSSGIQMVDVRDLAILHRMMLEQPVQDFVSQGRFIIAGHYYDWKSFHQMLVDITGRDIPGPKVPGFVLRAIGAIVDVLKKVSSIDTPISGESMKIVTQWKEASSSKILTRFSMAFRPGDETLRDTIQWLIDTGRLRSRRAS